MNDQLLKLLKDLNSTEKTSYFSYIKNKFKNNEQKFLKYKKTAIDLDLLFKIFDNDSFLKTIFKTTNNIKLSDYKTIRIRIHKTVMGPVALIDIKNDLEFDMFLKTILNSSNTQANQGACLIFNNKINIIIISHKPYSGINEKFFKLDKKEWLTLSTKIRIEHESTHYCIKQIYGHTKNNIHDELIADFIAITKIMKKFKAAWFMTFMQNKNPFGKCRFEIYVQGLPNKTKQAVLLTTQLCAKFLEQWNNSYECKIKNKIEKIKFLCTLGIKNMADLKINAK